MKKFLFTTGLTLTIKGRTYYIDLAHILIGALTLLIISAVALVIVRHPQRRIDMGK